MNKIGAFVGKYILIPSLIFVYICAMLKTNEET